MNAASLGSPRLQERAVSRWLMRDGARLHVLDRPGPAADSPMLLLVHGFRAHSRWWDEVAPGLTDRYRVVSFDFSGMGDSDARTHYAEDCFVEDLLAVVRDLDIQPHAVIGHSWGGQIVLEACARWPTMTRHALVLDTYLQLPSDTVVPEPLPVGNRRLHTSIEAAVSAFRLSPPQPLAQPVLEALARESLQKVEGGWRWKFDPAIPRIRVVLGEDLLPRVQQRVDVVYGEASTLVDMARAEGTARLLRDGHGPYVVANAHHHLVLDQPERLLALLRTLLADSRKDLTP